MKLKAGDLVEWYSVSNDHQRDYDVDTGIVLNISRSGARSHHAEVLFPDNEIVWIDFKNLKRVEGNEGNSF